MENCNARQVGGNHYQGEVQHWDIVHQQGWDYYVGAATKYLWRLGKKGDRQKHMEDIEKAIHFLEKKLEIMRKEVCKPSVTATSCEEPQSQGYVYQD